MTSRPAPNTRKLLIASAALLSIGLTGSIATGAYFTDQKVVTGNQLTAGTVVLGNIADDATSTTSVTFTNVLPIASSDISKKAQTFQVWIRNEGTAVWLPASTGDTYQGATFSFNLSVRAIQNGAPWL